MKFLAFQSRCGQSCFQGQENVPESERGYLKVKLILELKLEFSVAGETLTTISTEFYNLLLAPG